MEVVVKGKDYVTEIYDSIYNATCDDNDCDHQCHIKILGH